MNYIIGVGGGGSWLAHILAKLVKDITLVDGDAVEKKNLDRQLFTVRDIGTNKADALCNKLNLKSIPEFYRCGTVEHTSRDTIWSCVDNNRGRREILASVEQYKCRAIILGNETFSSEAYIVLPQWIDTPKDPRQFYPELLQDSGLDPIARSIGCTGEAQEANPQLASANYMAVGLAVHLWTMHEELRKLTPRQREQLLSTMPHRINANLTSVTCQ